MNAEGAVYCWGDNQYGQTNVPADLGRATQVSVNTRHACTLLAYGNVRC